MQNVKKITALETFPVRHAVLRKGKPIETCQFEGDDLPSTHHFDYLLNNELTGIISLFKNNNSIFAPNNQYQIQRMAVLELHQKKGFREALVIYCEEYCKKLQADLICFNAQTVAIGFFEKLGHTKSGVTFEIKDIGKHYLMVKNSNNE